MRLPRALSRRWRHTLRVHVVGCAPRSGTTLMHALLTRCYDLAGAHEHERSLARAPAQDGPYCTKTPHELALAARLLPLWPALHVVYMRRDGRDVITSRHRRDPERYWTPLRLWRSRERQIRALEGHPRVLVVRYEALVTDPQAVQQALEARWPVLRRRQKFAHSLGGAGAIHPGADEALGGLRPLDSRGVGRWRAHLARVKAQVLLHGSPTPELVCAGYEPDGAWERLLDDVEPDFTPSHWPEHLSARERWRSRARPLARAARLLLGAQSPAV